MDGWIRRGARHGDAVHGRRVRAGARAHAGASRVRRVDVGGRAARGVGGRRDGDGRECERWRARDDDDDDDGVAGQASTEREFSRKYDARHREREREDGWEETDERRGQLEDGGGGDVGATATRTRGTRSKTTGEGRSRRGGKEDEETGEEEDEEDGGEEDEDGGGEDGGTRRGRVVRRRLRTKIFVYKEKNEYKKTNEINGAVR